MGACQAYYGGKGILWQYLINKYIVFTYQETDPQTPTLDRLNDAALTLASMLITLDEYKIMRLAILSQ